MRPRGTRFVCIHHGLRFVRAVWFTLIQSQVAWFAAVLLAARSAPVAGALAALALTAIQIGRSGDPRSELRLVFAAAVLGALGDSVLACAQLLNFTSGTLVPGGTVGWMVALWMNFATVLSQSLRALHTRPLLAGALGAIGGPLAYAAGARLGALTLGPAPWALAAISLEWLIALPILCSIAQHRPARNP